MGSGRGEAATGVLAAAVRAMTTSGEGSKEATEEGKAGTEEEAMGASVGVLSSSRDLRFSTEDLATAARAVSKAVGSGDSYANRRYDSDTQY